MPKTRPISCWLSRMSPFKMWLNSCAITPWSSLRVEALERAARHGDRGIGARAPGRERVDARFLLEHVDLGHRHARGERHLLDDVHEAPLERVVAFAADARAAERACDVAAAARERRGAIEARQHHGAERADGDARPRGRHGRRATAASSRCRGTASCSRCTSASPRDDDRRRERDDDEREQEYADERAARAARLLLAREEVHGSVPRRG